MNTMIINFRSNRKSAQCGEGRQNIICRVCSSESCSYIGSQLMCSKQACNCNQKLHVNCKQFLTYQFIENLSKEYNIKAYRDCFEQILKSLQKLANLVKDTYNKTYEIYQTYMMPQPLKVYRKKLNKEGKVNKDESLKMLQFENQNIGKYKQKQISWEIPTITTNEQYKNRINFIRQQSQKILNQTSQYSRMLFESLYLNQNIGLKIVEDYNRSIKEAIDVQYAGRNQQFDAL